MCAARSRESQRHRPPRPASGVQPSWPSPPGSQWLGAHIVGDARPPAAQPDGATGLGLPKVYQSENRQLGATLVGGLHGDLRASGPGPGRSLDAGPTSQPLGTQRRADGPASPPSAPAGSGSTLGQTLADPAARPGSRRRAPAPVLLGGPADPGGGPRRLFTRVCAPSALPAANQELVTGAAAEMEEFVHRTGAWSGPQDSRPLTLAGQAGGQARV